MCTIVIEALTPLDRSSDIKMYENNARSRLFCRIAKRSIVKFYLIGNYIGEGEGEVAFLSAKRWDRRNRADLIESATPCHDAQVVGPYRDSNPLRLTVLAAMSDGATTPSNITFTLGFV